MAFDRRLMANFDWMTVSLTLLIMAFSTVILYSATYNRTAEAGGMHLKQLAWMGIGLVAMFTVLCLDYQIFCRYAYLFYCGLLLSLIAVLLFGRVINGAQRWLTFGPISIQTSELAKPVLILVLARYFTTDAPPEAFPLTLRGLFVPLGLVGLPCWLIMKQPDLSTAMVLVAIMSVMVLMVGIRGKTLLTITVLGVGLLPAMWYMLKEYQRGRILTLLNPQADLLGTGYHAWQAKIAIGSGGMWGKGLLAGTQSHLHFVPERHTDFIFAVLAEEGGFVGVVLLITLFSCLLLHGLAIAYATRERQGALIVVGVVTMVSTQVFLNIGMTLGLLPILGLPLPLVSYGGSSLVMTFCCLGLLMNVRMRRWKLGILSP